MIYVKPRAGLALEDGSSYVRDPVSKARMPAIGRYVPESSHWIRAIAAGDVLISAPPLAIAPPALPVVQVDQIPDSNAGEE